MQGRSNHDARSPYIRPMRSILVLLSVAFAAVGSAAPVDVAAYALDTITHRLDNGFTILVSRDPGVQDAAVELWFRVGSADEAPGQHGYAHLFEHLFPPATEFLANPANRALLDRDRLDSNGATAAEYTRWVMRVPATSVELPIASFATRMAAAPESITQADLEKHQQTVLAEFRNGAGRSWDPAVTAQMRRALFGDQHPYGHAGLGTTTEVEGATLDAMRRWHERYFGASNAMLVVVGNVDADHVVARAKKHFGSMRNGSSFFVASVPVEPTPERREITIYAAGARPALELRWRAPGFADVTRHELLIARDLLRERLASIDGCTISGAEELEAKNAGEVAIRLQCAPGANVAGTALRELDAFLATTPDIEAARQERLAAFGDALSRLGWRPSRAQLLGEGLWLAGDPLIYLKHVEHVSKVSSGGVMQAARLWMKNPLVVHVRPALVEAGAPDRGAALTLPAPSVDVPGDVVDRIEHRVRVVSVVRRAPVVVARVVLRSGGGLTVTTTSSAFERGLRDALRDRKRGDFDLVVVGDVERDRIVALARTLPSSETAPPEEAGDPPRFVATPGAPQTRITAIAQFGPHVDEASVELAADLLRTRLNDRLRETERWVYSVDVRAEQRGEAETIVIEAPIRDDLAARAIPVVEEYLAGLASGTLTDVERARAQGAVLRRLTALSSASYDLAGALATIVRSGQSYERYTSAQLAIYEAITRGDLKLPKPSRVVWSVAGDPDRVDPALK